MDAEAFQQRFVAWVSDVFTLTAGQVIAIDGKAVRGTYDNSGKAGLHLVSAWATANGLTLAQVAVADKAKRLEPIIEKVESRRPEPNAPQFDEGYSYGGLPTGRNKFTATEIPEAMAEMNQGRVEAARRLKEQQAK